MGLVLRWSTADDVDSIAEFASVVFRETADESPHVHMADRVRSFPFVGSSSSSLSHLHQPNLNGSHRTQPSVTLDLARSALKQIARGRGVLVDAWTRMADPTVGATHTYDKHASA